MIKQVLTVAERRELIMALWRQVRRRHTRPPVILGKRAGYDERGDDRDFFREREQRQGRRRGAV